MIEQGEQIVGERRVGVVAVHGIAGRPAVPPCVVADQTMPRVHDRCPVEEAHPVVGRLAHETAVRVHGERAFTGIVVDEFGPAVPEAAVPDRVPAHATSLTRRPCVRH